MTQSSPKILLITGVSSGLGQAFAAGALAAGHIVIGSVRRAEDAVSFSAQAPGQAYPLILDVTNYDAIQAQISAGFPLDRPLQAAGVSAAAVNSLESPRHRGLTP